jgi:hypothetical protein
LTPREYAIQLHQAALQLVHTDQIQAYRMIVNACEADPGYAEGWRFLGAALADLGYVHAAVSALRHALRCPEIAPATELACLVNLGHRLIDNRIISDEGLTEALAVTEAAISMGEAAGSSELVGPIAFAHTNRSLIAAHMGDKSAEMLLALIGFNMCPEPPTELGVAFAELFQGYYGDGLRHFEARYASTPQLAAYRSLPWPQWDGGPVDTLLVMPDMGLGDSLSFARFIPEAAERVGRLVFQCQPELVRLLSDTLVHPGGNISVIPNDYALPQVDAWTAVFSLPIPLRLRDAEIRDRHWTIRPKAVEDRSWKRPDARLHVAIAWAGAPGNAIDVHRSIPFTEFLALREVPGIALYSVQVGERAIDLHEHGGAALVRDLSPWIRDARDTAGILAEMDCVVTAESFVGHLAGAIGKRCLLLCSRWGRDWRSSPYLGDRALWYPEHRVLRQGPDAKWGPVFRAAVGALS